MALKIRLRQQGRRNRLSYRLIVTDSRSPRDGKYVESLGWYDPHKKEEDCSFHEERIAHWLGHGAQLSEKAASLVKRKAPGVLAALKEKKATPASK